MNECRLDLAHAVALGQIDDEDRTTVQHLLDSEDHSLRAGFVQEVRVTKEVLALLAPTTAVAPPSSLRARLLSAVAAEQPPVAS